MASKKDKIVQVLIRGSAKVNYNQTVSMTQGEFDRLDYALGDCCAESACEQVQDYLDLMDVSDDIETLEVDTFEIVKQKGR
jgi:hypothetical protein